MENRLNKEIIALNKKLKMEQEKNIQLSNTINELNQKLFNQQKLNMELNNKIKYLEEKIKNYEIKAQNQITNTTMNDLLTEIKELKQKLKRYPINLEKGEKLMLIHFNSIDQKIQNYCILCKNTDPLNSLENQLYKQYEQYADSINYFTVGGKRVSSNKTLEENGIKNNDVIILNVYEQFE